MEYRVNNLIYAAEKDLHNTIRTIFEMTEPVNVDMLRGAADLAITRYPYGERDKLCTGTAGVFRDKRFYSSRVTLLQPVRNITTGRVLFL